MCLLNLASNSALVNGFPSSHELMKVKHGLFVFISIFPKETQMYIEACGPSNFIQILEHIVVHRSLSSMLILYFCRGNEDRTAI